jgi:Mg2+ and Co2+ transporter CorA
MSSVNLDLHDLQQQVIELRDRMSRAEGKIEQVNRAASDTSRQTIWQFVIFTVTMAGVLAGMTVYQTEALRRETNARFESVEKRIDQMEKNLNTQMDQLERSLTARFDDLKQVVLSDRKQTAQSSSQGKK